MPVRITPSPYCSPSLLITVTQFDIIFYPFVRTHTKTRLIVAALPEVSWVQTCQHNKMHIARLKTNRIQNFLQLGYPFVFPFDFPFAATFQTQEHWSKHSGKILKTTPRQSVSPMRTTHRLLQVGEGLQHGQVSFTRVWSTLATFHQVMNALPLQNLCGHSFCWA